MHTWFVYMLRCGDGSLYTGISNHVEKRVKRHSKGHGAAYTRSHLPITLVWKRAMKSESAARKEEAKIKGWTKIQKEHFIRKER